MTPTSRTLQRARELGFIAEKVEQRIGKPSGGFGFTRDFINVIDIIAFKEGVGIVGIQATGGDGGNHAARMAKMRAEPMLAEWLKAGGKAEVWSWAKRGARGARKLWTLRRESVTLDLPPPESSAKSA